MRRWPGVAIGLVAALAIGAMLPRPGSTAVPGRRGPEEPAAVVAKGWRPTPSLPSGPVMWLLDLYEAL